ncbi:MAG: hypothetical protein WCT49_00245 [Candidatus Paceibacterota bacterium]|jgi:hypothetical protein|nr:hypothetical protein [Candidatus Paceibacterota bacterium]
MTSKDITKPSSHPAYSEFGVDLIAEQKKPQNKDEKIDFLHKDLLHENGIEIISENPEIETEDLPANSTENSKNEQADNGEDGPVKVISL